MMRRLRWILLSFFLPLLATDVAVAVAHGRDEESLRRADVTVIPSNKPFKRTGRLTRNVRDADGFYRHVYELSEEAVRGGTGNGSEIRVLSKDFLPRLRLYQGNKLLREVLGEEDYHSAKYRWTARLSVIMPRPGPFRLVVTTEKRGGEGKYRLQYDPLPGLTIN